MFLDIDIFDKHSQTFKRLANATFRRLKAFHIYGGLGMSASPLHGEFTDSVYVFSLSSYGAIIIIFFDDLHLASMFCVCL